jgi:hypothetical protein
MNGCPDNTARALATNDMQIMRQVSVIFSVNIANKLIQPLAKVNFRKIKPQINTDEHR